MAIAGIFQSPENPLPQRFEILVVKRICSCPGTDQLENAIRFYRIVLLSIAYKRSLTNYLWAGALFGLLGLSSDFERLSPGAHLLVGTCYSPCPVIGLNPLTSVFAWPSILEACVPTISRLRVTYCFPSGITPCNTETLRVSSVIRDDLLMHGTVAATDVRCAIPLFNLNDLASKSV
jgi:hypothetical protein